MSVVFGLGAFLVGLSSVDAATPRRPFPQNVPYAVGSLFPNHLTTEEINDDVRAAFWRWRAAYVEQAGVEADGRPRCRIKLGRSADEATVSEGQGYGMVIMALMAGEDPDAQTVFDGLWEFFNDHRSEIDPRLMDWHVPANEAPEPGDDDSAFDGDCDIAYALLLANTQWGDQGLINYRAEFEEIISGIADSTIGPQSRLPMLGDWVDPDGATFNQYTPRTSDLMPGHFRAFSRATRTDLWKTAADVARQTIDSLQALHAPETGLLPDFAVSTSPTDHMLKPAPPNFLEGPHDPHYFYNAGRDPWRIATDALINSNTASRNQSARISRWIRRATAENPRTIKGGYRLDGNPIGNYFSSFFAAPLAVAAMLDPDAQFWLNEVYDEIRDAEEGYFEDSVTLLCLLVISHNFWDPTQLPHAEALTNLQENLLLD